MPVLGPRDARLGNNGNTNGFQEWRCCRTQKEANPWWEVDLEQECDLAGIHLWKGMTYHEQSKNPDGQPPSNWAASTARNAPPAWVFVSNEPFDRSSASLEHAKASAAQESPAVHAFQLGAKWGSRVEHLWFDKPVGGRYLRLQLESASSALQFAELEVFSAAPAGQDTPLQRDDGVYGFDAAPDSDFREYIENGWLDPSRNESELRLWVGSFVEKSPAVQWIANDTSSAYSVELKHEKHSGLEPSASQAVWQPQAVTTTSCAVLDKQSVELRELLEDYQQNHARYLAVFLNNDSSMVGRNVVAEGSQWLRMLGLCQLLNDSELDALLKHVTTVSFAPGDVLLDYGEHQKRMLFIREGSVEVLGAKSATGVDVLGTLEESAFFNELALIHHWSRFPAAFRAKTAVVCEVLDESGLVAALGGLSGLHKLREHYIRSYASAIPFGPGKPNAAPTLHYTDSTHAQVFRTKVPTELVSGSVAVPATSALSHRLTFEIYGIEEHSGVRSRGSKLLGSASLLLSQIGAHGEGDLTVPVFDNGVAVGQLSLEYLILKPFTHLQNNLSYSWRTYWRPRAPLAGGHRGMGRSFYQVAGFRHALTRENTLASLILAGKSGADFVEFDVQLTKDRVPVVYHDFVLNVGLEDNQAWSKGTKAEEFEVGIHDLTLRQLTRSWIGPLHRRPGAPAKGPQLKQLIKKHWSVILGKQASSSSAARSRMADKDGEDLRDDDHLVAFVPQLKDLLRNVPAETGLNIEIKYPDNFWRSAMRASPCFAMNSYLDEILRCVFDHAGSRRIFFSCFDPNVCVLLRAKQTRYPVLFLTYGSIKPTAFDARLTLQFAVNIAKMERLQGIVSMSDDFIATPALAQVVKQQLLSADVASALMTWGDQNTSHECVQIQKRAGIDGIISDNVLDLTRSDEKARGAHAS